MATAKDNDAARLHQRFLIEHAVLPGLYTFGRKSRTGTGGQARLRRCCLTRHLLRTVLQGHGPAVRDRHIEGQPAWLMALQTLRECSKKSDSRRISRRQVLAKHEQFPATDAANVGGGILVQEQWQQA